MLLGDRRAARRKSSRKSELLGDRRAVPRKSLRLRSHRRARSVDGHRRHRLLFLRPMRSKSHLRLILMMSTTMTTMTMVSTLTSMKRSVMTTTMTMMTMMTMMAMVATTIFGLRTKLIRERMIPTRSCWLRKGIIQLPMMSLSMALAL